MLHQSQREVGLLTEQLAELQALQDKTEAELLEAQSAHKASVAQLSEHQVKSCSWVQDAFETAPRNVDDLYPIISYLFVTGFGPGRCCL